MVNVTFIRMSSLDISKEFFSKWWVGDWNNPLTTSRLIDSAFLVLLPGRNRNKNQPMFCWQLVQRDLQGSLKERTERPPPLSINMPSGRKRPPRSLWVQLIRGDSLKVDGVRTMTRKTGQAQQYPVLQPLECNLGKKAKKQFWFCLCMPDYLIPLLWWNLRFSSKEQQLHLQSPSRKEKQTLLCWRSGKSEEGHLGQMDPGNGDRYYLN